MDSLMYLHEGWHFCAVCRSSEYVVNDYPQGHWAYSYFKTKDKQVFEDHKHTPSHIEYFEKLYCDACDEQCYFQNQFDKHCESVKHKKNNKIIMECKTCGYSTTNKYVYETHLQSKRHFNKLNGVQKEVFFCEVCNYTAKSRSQLAMHEDSNKHKTAVLKGGIIHEELVCKACNYKTFYPSQMKIHERTKKHQKLAHTHIENSEVV
jgi:hypothetical protein